jgi:DNA-binding NarL/FixJ family response regulator
MMNDQQSASMADDAAAKIWSGAMRLDVQTPQRILVAEDDLFVGVQYEDALSEAGFEVLDIATTAKEAIDIAQDQKPVLAIMDIRLAGSPDGVEAALEIYRRFGIRCIFATAFSDPEVRERAAPARPLAWLSKPVAYPRLIAAVRAALSELENESRGN